MRQKITQRKMTRALVLLGSAVAVTLNPAMMVAQLAPALNKPTTAPVTQPIGADVTVATTSPTTMPATQATAKKTKSPTTRISMRFKDAPVDAVLEHLSQEAGFEVVKDAPIDGRVTVWSDQPVSPEEAVTLLNTLLKGNGYTAIQMGRILKITSREKAKKGSIPVHFGSDPDLIPLTDDLVTQVIPLKSVDAVKLKTDMQPLVGTDADLTANAASNSLMITDTSANIHRVVEIVSNLDKTQATENDIVVQQLKYADATATAKLITDIFKPADATQGNAQQQNPFARFGRGGGGGPGGGGGFPFGGGGGGGNNAEDNEKGRTGTVTASADTRTNTIVVTGPKETLATIKSEILSKIDANPAADQKFFTYKVLNGQAIDMAATLNNLFSGTTTSNTSSRTSQTSSSTGNRTSSGFGGSNSSGIGNGATSFGGGGGGGGNNGNRNGNTSSTSGQNGGNRTGATAQAGGAAGGTGTSSAAAELIGQVVVVADVDTNTLLVVTATKYADDVMKIIKDLDRPVPQVLIKALIAEVTHDRSDDLGVDFSILNLTKGLSGGSTVGNIASGTANGGLVVTLAESQISTTFHALAVAGKLDVLSRPYILTSDNQEANILVGQEVPFITNSRIDALGGQVNTIQYQDIGIILDVTPHINPDGLVVMDVEPQISSQSDQTVPIQAGVNAPVFNQRSASSHVAIRDGETIVIGGLMQDQKTQTVTKVPILGDIPYLGLLFQRDQVTKTKTELLIFLTPHVAQTPDHLRIMSTDEMHGIHLTPGAVQEGMFQEHIKGLQLGGSATQPALPIPKPEFDRGAWEPEPKMP